MAVTQTEAASSAQLTAVTGSLEATQLSLAEDLRGQTYVALGDSLSVGHDAPAPGQICPAVIARTLAMSLTLVPHSGTRAPWGAAQLPPALAAHPRLVTIELGTNDRGSST